MRAITDDEVDRTAFGQLRVDSGIGADHAPDRDLIAEGSGDLSDHEPGLFQSRCRVGFAQASHVGHRVGGHRLSHRELDGRAFLYQFSGRGILGQDHSWLFLVGPDRDDADHQPVVGGRGLGLLERHAPEVGCAHDGDSGRALAGRFGDGRARRERSIDIGRVVEWAEEDEDDGQRHDEGTHQDAADQQHGRALVGRLVAGRGRRRVRRLERDLRLGSECRERRFGGFGIGSHRRRRPGSSGSGCVGSLGFCLGHYTYIRGNFPGLSVGGLGGLALRLAGFIVGGVLGFSVRGWIQRGLVDGLRGFSVGRRFRVGSLL